MSQYYGVVKTMKKGLLVRRINIAGKNYKQAWGPIISGLTALITKRITGDASYLDVANVVNEYTDIPMIRRGLMKIVNNVYEVGL